MSEEFETSWPMGSAPVGRKLERPRLPKGRLGEFRVLDVAIPELIAHARRQVPEIANEDLHVNGKMFTDKVGVRIVRPNASGWCGTAGTASATGQGIGAAAASGRPGFVAANPWPAVAAGSRSATTRYGSWITTT
jgi:hypothetical protein